MPLLIFFLVLFAFTPVSANAQSVVAIVNGSPITSYDLDQRTKLLRVSTRSAPSRSTVLEELIEDKIKLQEAERADMLPEDSAVDRAFNSVASSAGLSRSKFIDALNQSGINSTTLKERIKADMAWRDYIQRRFGASVRVRDADVVAFLKDQGKDPVGQTYEYTMIPILFVVPRGSSESLYARRRSEASRLRARFTSCEQGIALARGMLEVVVRNSVIRTSSALSPAMREDVNATQVGRATQPDRTEQGIEIVAICDKQQVQGDSILQTDTRNELTNERFQDRAETHMKDLREKAVVIIR